MGVRNPNIVKKLVSADPTRTIKYLLSLRDGLVIEATYVDHPRKHIICFSSQVGCAVGCAFCVLGVDPRAQFARSLSYFELVKQCKIIIDDLKLLMSEKPILFSCMGMGEPLLNYDNVVKALKFLGHTYPNSRLALSTSGIRPDYIEALAGEEFSVPFKLQISLHAPDTWLRTLLMPATKEINDLVSAVQWYWRECGRTVEWNYILLRNVNDSLKCASVLAELLGPGWHVKLSAYNHIEGTSLRGSERETIQAFKKRLEEGGLTTELYETNGQDINAACGQLAYRDG